MNSYNGSNGGPSTLLTNSNSNKKAEHENESDSIVAVARGVSDVDYQQETETDLHRRADQLAEAIYKWVNKLAEGKRKVKEQFDEILAIGRKVQMSNEKLGNILRDSFHKRGVSDSYIRKIMPPELRVASHTNIRYLPDSNTDSNTNNSYVSVLPPKGKLNDSGNTLVPPSTQNNYLNTDMKPQTIYPSESEPQQQAITQDVNPFEEEIKNLKHELVIKTKQIQRYENDLENVKRELKEARHFLKEDTFIARTYLTLGDNDVPIRVVVNIANKEIESAEIDNEALKSAMMRAK